MTGLLHTTRDRRSSLSLCRRSLTEESGERTQLQSASNTATHASTIVVCGRGSAECMTRTRDINKQEKLWSYETNQRAHDLCQSNFYGGDVSSETITRAQRVSDPPSEMTFLQYKKLKVGFWPTCGLAILFVFGARTFLLFLLTFGPIGCHVCRGLSGSGSLGGKTEESWESVV